MSCPTTKGTIHLDNHDFSYPIFEQSKKESDVEGFLGYKTKTNE